MRPIRASCRGWPRTPRLRPRQPNCRPASASSVAGSGLRSSCSRCSSSLVGWLAITAPLSQVAAADRAAQHHPARRRRHADRAARRDHRQAGRRRQAARACRQRLSRDRGPALLQPLGHRSARHRARRLAQHDGGRRARGRQHDHPAARQDRLSRVRPHRGAQAARGADRLLARGVAVEGRDPRRAICRTSISATMSTACARRRCIISTAQPERSDDRRRRRCWPGCVKAPSRLAPDRQPEGRARRARRWWSRRWSMPASSTRRPPPACRPARLVASRRKRDCPTAPISPTGCCPRRATGPARSYAERRVKTTLDSRLQRVAERAVRRAGLRQGAGRAGGDAPRRPGRRDGRRQALCRQPVQPRDPGAAPAGIDLQAVRLSRRDARAA